MKFQYCTFQQNTKKLTFTFTSKNQVQVFKEFMKDAHIRRWEIGTGNWKTQKDIDDEKNNIFKITLWLSPDYREYIYTTDTAWEHSNELEKIIEMINQCKDLAEIQDETEHRYSTILCINDSLPTEYSTPTTDFQSHPVNHWSTKVLWNKETKRFEKKTVILI